MLKLVYSFSNVSIHLSLIFNFKYLLKNSHKMIFTTGIKDIVDYNSSEKIDKSDKSERLENSHGHKLCKNILIELLREQKAK